MSDWEKCTVCGHELWEKTSSDGYEGAYCPFCEGKSKPKVKPKNETTKADIIQGIKPFTNLLVAKEMSQYAYEDQIALHILALLDLARKGEI